eukprot:NODE_21629_length_744_cov_1.649919.p2 GENE.NODE_21629_length_744_cov_1.649919~~NODE_21629_length_744_cov_1.649919.p2  ORF type:complete len:88 (+),score=6.05 NODE_21629_length_744_cov_1.649919:153-416(+)
MLASFIFARALDDWMRAGSSKPKRVKAGAKKALQTLPLTDAGLACSSPELTGMERDGEDWFEHQFHYVRWHSAPGGSDDEDQLVWHE